MVSLAAALVLLPAAPLLGGALLVAGLGESVFSGHRRYAIAYGLLLVLLIAAVALTHAITGGMPTDARPV